MTTFEILYMIAIIPVILILYYIYTKDKNKEPRKLLIKLFISGIVSCFLVLIITEILGIFIPIIREDTNNLNMFELLIVSFIGVALIEEFCKWIMVYNIGYKSKEFDEFYDGIVYAIFVSLGFAALENILYVFGTNSILVGITRGLLSIPGHACFGLFMGYYLSKAKLSQKDNKMDKQKLYLFLSLFIPMIFHGLFDYFIFIGNVLFTILYFAFVIFLFTYSIIKIKKSSKNETRLIKEQKYCTNCGTLLKGLYCDNCGKKQD